MLENIFKKKIREKQEQKPKIIADYREKNSLVIPTLYELGADIEVKNLKIGDYLVGEIVVERKTFSDFLGSMINKRLIEQLRNLKQYKKSILIIENYDAYRIDSFSERKISPNSIRGFILSILLNYRVPIIFTEDSEETAMYLVVLAKQQIKPGQEISLHSRIPKTKKERKKFILEAFPHIGPKTAEKLLKKFKTLKNIINAPKNELEKEIGKAKAESFKIIEE